MKKLNVISLIISLIFFLTVIFIPKKTYAEDFSIFYIFYSSYCICGSCIVTLLDIYGDAEDLGDLAMAFGGDSYSGHSGSTIYCWTELAESGEGGYPAEMDGPCEYE